ncbi:hypothetical protein E1301_Tti009265 [Triplophysa tibetana]|uniref:Lamina-associated polypeptide 2 alpha C-terminal domain-containing protein n=1 Tax=Triplophysa tibetana TaxID=1572043 RepID=A0A5A9NVT0_9TELE|nr:hypothetical protein E1301_Tti009265 [Triplophysa tibetana]
MSKQEFRRCMPPCPRYIMGNDTHTFCVFCLGLEHARSAFRETDCPHCEHLPSKTLRSRLALFCADRSLATAPRISGSTSVETVCQPESMDEGRETTVSLSLSLSTGSEDLAADLEAVSSAGRQVGAETGRTPPIAYEDLVQVIARAVAKLSLDWPYEQEQVVQSKLDDRFFTASQVQPPCRNLPFFPDLHTELSKTWKNPYSSHAFKPSTSIYSSIVGLQEHGYGAMPKVEEALEGLLSPSTASPGRKPALPSRMCRNTSILVGRAYAAAGQAGASLHTLGLLQAYQADLLKDLDQGGGLDGAAVQELRRATDLALRTTKQTARAIGRSMASLVLIERILWLDLTAIRGNDKLLLLNAPIVPRGLFGESHNAVMDKHLEAKKQFESFKSPLPYWGPPSLSSGTFSRAGTSAHVQQQKASVAARAPPHNWSIVGPQVQAQQSKRRSDLRTVIASKTAKKNL